MPTLKEVLADKAKYPDNLVWNLEGGTAVTLAQLRGLSDENQSAITKREADLVKASQAVSLKEEELKKAQLNTANLYTTMTQALEAMKAGRLDDPSIKQIFGSSPIPGATNGNGNNDPFAALSRLESDTLMGPVVSVIKAVNAEAKKAQEAVAQNIEVQKKMATNYMNGVLEDRYDRLVPADKQEKITLASLIQDAVRNNEFSSDSVPDIRKAYKRATAGDEAATREAAIRADERKKLEAEIAARSHGGSGEGIFVPAPQNFGLDVHNRTGAAPKPFKNLDEAFTAAANDKDIWNSVDGLTH